MEARCTWEWWGTAREASRRGRAPSALEASGRCLTWMEWSEKRRLMSSVVKKRRKKIRKHKYKKLRARTRIERRKRR
jgi:hypothetical protein